MTVTFCGHRTLEHPVQVKSWLREVVCDLIGQGANTFLLGGYGAFDLILLNEICEAALRTLRSPKSYSVYKQK